MLLVALVACGGGDDTRTRDRLTRTSRPTTTTTAPTTTVPPTTATTAPPPPVSPLTGLPTDPATLSRPAIVVKIDNHKRKARPQAGLIAADVVFEEMVEGGNTRFAAVFQSTEADPLGPIRSTRTTDLGLVGMLNRPLLAWSGANDAVAASTRAAPIVDAGVEATPGAYNRRGDRQSPSNLFSSTPALRAARPGGAPPVPMFAFRPVGAPPAGGRPVGGVRLAFGGLENLTAVYGWDAGLGGWRRAQDGTPHLDLSGGQVAPANVIVQFTDYVDAGYVDTTGAPSPEAKLMGTGKAWVLTGGHVIEATWRRDDPARPTVFVGADGQPVLLAPGRTWVEWARPDQAALT